MAILPSLESAGNLFSTNLIFRVPKYQRYYAWDSEQITDFLNDLELCWKARQNGDRREHFFGGLVTVRVNVPGSSRQNMEVIDGQQRLASFVMLASQLSNAALKLADLVDLAASDSPKQFLLDFAERLKLKFERYKDVFNLQVVVIDRLELSKPDLVFFKDLLEGRNPTAARQSHRLLRQAWDRIEERLGKLLQPLATDVEKATAISVVETIMDKDWILIHMITDSKNEAYRLFRVLNDRGTGLTEGELLRAQILEAIEVSATPGELLLVEETWDKILAAAPDLVEQQLRSIYASMTGKRAGKATLLDDFLAQLFPTLTMPMTPASVSTVVTQVQRIHAETIALGKLQDGDWPFPSTTKVTGWDKSRLGLLILELKHTNSMPLLLAATQLQETMFSDVVQTLERFMFRYKIVSNAHIGAATTVYHEQAVEIRRDPKKYKLSMLTIKLQALLDKHAKDALFRNRLAEMVYERELTNRPLKYFLITLENYLKWYRNGANGAPKCLDKMQVFDPAATTVEHIYPEKASPADPIMLTLLDTLGNLTLLGSKDNDAAGNKPFDAKKIIFAKSPLLLNQEIAKNIAWTEAIVKARQTDLESAAVHIFKLK